MPACVAWSWVLGSLWLAMPGTGSAHPGEYGSYDGEQLYRRFCASCHGLEGRGDGPVAGVLTVLVPDLTEIAQRNRGVFPADRVAGYIDGEAEVPAHGDRQMPVWGMGFWVDQGADEAARASTGRLIQTLVDYLESLQDNGQPARESRSDY